MGLPSRFLQRSNGYVQDYLVPAYLVPVEVQKVVLPPLGFVEMAYPSQLMPEEQILQELRSDLVDLVVSGRPESGLDCSYHLDLVTMDQRSLFEGPVEVRVGFRSLFRGFEEIEDWLEEMSCHLTA